LKVKPTFLVAIYYAFFLISYGSFSQDIKKYDTRYSNYESFKTYLKPLNDSIKSLEIHNYLAKAKLERNAIKMADGYFLLSECHSKKSLGGVYADSIIQVSKDLNDFRYPGFGYFQKGLQLYYASDYKGAFPYYLKADSCASKTKNDFLKLRVKHSIGALKGITGQINDALVYFKEVLDFFKNEENKTKYQDQYFKTLFAIGNAYSQIKKTDSSLYYNKRGFVEGVKTKDKALYPLFLMSYGISKKQKREFEDGAIDSLLKGISFIRKDLTNVAKGYITIGEIYTGQKKHKVAFRYFKKVDSMHTKFPNRLEIQALNAYDLINKYYLLFPNNEERLKTIDKIIEVSDIVASDKGLKHLSADILKKYDFPKLSIERNNLIKKLEIQTEKQNKALTILSVTILLLLFIVIYSQYRNRLNKKRFNNLVAKQSLKENGLPNRTADRELKKSLSKGLSEDLVNDILEKIKGFEDSKKYIKTHYTLASLAKELNTNSAYLSKIINTYKKVNFSNYLNGLRIDSIIERLTTDKMLRSYTINAISEEAGFNNVQSFSTAFHKKTGINPSYFVKQLEKQNNG